MGQKVSHSTLVKYIEQTVKIRFDSQNQTVQEYVGSVLDSSIFCPPFRSFDLLDERCSFIEAIALGRERSLLYGRLEMTENILIIGLEQSSAFVGKQSLFTGFAVEDFDHLADVFNKVKTSRPYHKKGYLVTSRVVAERVFVTCPFSAFLDIM